ncbi:MAG: tetratricopeptide repeat protein [Limisphaerales bacterium]
MSRGSKKEASAVRLNAPVSPAVDETDAAVCRSLKPDRCLSAGTNPNWLVPGICVFLAAIVWVVFGQTLRYGFVIFDDDQYVYDNPIVQKGLTWEGFRWGLTCGGIGHWHPLTWVSHMLDCQLYGLHAGGHHLTNIVFHAAATILLFLVLRRMTGLLWRSAFVAAVFAIHPLRAESVAWISERKDVLSAFFFMLTFLCYAKAVTSDKWLVTSTKTSAATPAAILSRVTCHQSPYYYLALMFFTLGLLSKNMLVTLPFVLLLLDYWPLGRVTGDGWRVTRFGIRVPQLSTYRHLLLEKLPFFVLVVGSCVATALVPEKVTVADKLPLGLRLENGLVSYVVYLWQMVYPSGLACVYPNPTHDLPVWQVGGALGLLLAISGAVYAIRKTQPWLIVGWLWFVGMLVPVIGLVQISYYAHADRYTYLPEVGLYLMVTWTASELCAGWRQRRLVLGGLATVILVALILCARTQTMYWRDSETLWNHTLACTSDNAVAHFYLGKTLFQKGQTDEAIAQYQQALEIKPNYAAAHGNIGNALVRKGQMDEAIAQYQQALQIDPDYAKVCNNLGNVLLSKGRSDEAVIQYQKALQLKPDAVDVLNNLAWLLATSPDAHIRNGVQAVRYAERACELTHDDTPMLVGALAAAYAETGRFPEAVKTAQRALQLAETQSNLALADAIRSQMNLYQAGIPFRQ